VLRHGLRVSGERDVGISRQWQIMNDIFKIKHATLLDVPLILSFIKELAEYENHVA
jgi:hypothetical protein